MKKFVRNLSLIISVIAVFNVVVYIFAYKMYYQDYTKVPDKSFNKFIFADSHGLPLGNYTEKFNVYNFAAASESYLDIKRKIEFLIKEDYTLDTVYITVDDHTLSPYRDTRDNDTRSVYFSSVHHFDNFYTYTKRRYVSYYGAIFEPDVRALLKNYLNEKIQTAIAKGQTPLDIKSSAYQYAYSALSIQERKIAAENRKAFQFPSDSSSMKLERQLREIITLSKKHNFKLIGVKFPLSKEFIDIIGEANYGADKIFKEQNLQILDHKRTLSRKDRYFQNQDHLNDEGGALFVNMLLAP